nr:copia protein [Tanacetum cinerariifolium]
MNYQPVVAGTQPNDNAGIKENLDAENENDVHVSPSCSDNPKKHDDKDKRDDRGKSPNCWKIFICGPSNYLDDPNMPALEDIVYSDDKEDVGAEADFSNLKTHISVSPMPTTRVHKDHLVTQILGDLTLAPQTRSMERINPREYTKHSKILVGLKPCKKSFYSLKCNRNKAKVVAQGHTQEEGIDYDEFFAPVVRIKAIWLFLAYASFMGFMVYQMDVKIGFLYGTIKEEVYACQPPRFKDPDYPDKVYKVVKTLYGLHQALRAHVAFFPKDKLRFAARHVAFCCKTRCVLLQDILRFASKLIAFCFKACCVLLQDTLRFALRHLAFCLKILVICLMVALRFVYF